MHSDSNCNVNTDLMHYAITTVGILTKLLFESEATLLYFPFFCGGNVTGSYLS